MTHVVAQHRCIRLDTLWYGWDKSDGGFSQTERPPHCQANKVKGEAIPSEPTSDHSDRNRQSSNSGFYEEGKVPRMAGQCGSGTKEGW